MKCSLYAASAVTAALALNFFGCGFHSEPLADLAPEKAGLAQVERVIDGDTVVLSRGLGSSRLVGVDTPETVAPGSGVECFGPQATAFTQRVLARGRVVRYRLARQPLDDYGRRLVYVWLTGGPFFNAMLVRGGYARPLPIAPNTRYASHFQRLAEEASAAGRGLWERCRG